MKREQHGILYHFPSLYEGDCFYDILTRFYKESGHIKHTSASRELFGSTPDLRASVVLPYRAGMIDVWLGENNGISLQELRDLHSAWQYLQISSRFTQKSLDSIIRGEALPGRRRQAQMRLALQGNLTHIRYCPLCLLRDNLMHNESFWHQVHQIFGVKYCPIHGILLQNSDVSIEKRLMRFIPASSIPQNQPMSAILPDEVSPRESDPYQDTYISLSKTIAWLLKHGLEFGEEQDLARKYATALGNRNKQVNGCEMVEVMTGIAGKEFLEDLYSDRCSTILEQTSIAGIRSMGPLEHALVIMALGIVNHQNSKTY